MKGLPASPQEWIRDAEAVEEVQIMEELPHQLRRDISFSINRKVFKQLNLFHDFPAREQALIASSMTPIQASSHTPPSSGMCPRRALFRDALAQYRLCGCKQCMLVMMPLRASWCAHSICACKMRSIAEW